MVARECSFCGEMRLLWEIDEWDRVVCFRCEVIRDDLEVSITEFTGGEF